MAAILNFCSYYTLCFTYFHQHLLGGASVVGFNESRVAFIISL